MCGRRTKNLLAPIVVVTLLICASLATRASGVEGRAPRVEFRGRPGLNAKDLSWLYPWPFLEPPPNPGRSARRIPLGGRQGLLASRRLPPHE
jgi:hypothetical protein